jgi:hypothetical protein
MYQELGGELEAVRKAQKSSIGKYGNTVLVKSILPSLPKKGADEH